jgi:Zn-dependent protease
MEAVLILLGWIFSVCLHEYAHALTAWYGGDKTVEDKGYLDFNPFCYAHPLLSIGLPILFLLMGGIPLMGGAVYIDHTRIRSRWWDSAVSAAGPAANLFFGAVLCVPFAAGLADPGNNVWQVVACLIFLNFFVALLNLVPIPGLDGFGIIRPHLSYAARERSDEVARYGVFILWGLLLMAPGVGLALGMASLVSAAVLGVPPSAAMEGFGFLDVLRLR